MRAIRLAVLLTSLVTLGPMLSACADFDLDKLDVFGLNEKKKLPGERRALFPEGVPGVTQGVPPELIKGNQPPPEEVAATPAPAPVAAPEKPKPKPRVAKRPTRITVSPDSGTQARPQQQQPADSPWPSTPQQPAAQSPWPAPPASGTFSR